MANPGDMRREACACSNIIQDDDGNVISGLTDQILGGDDEWYCKKCEPLHYDQCYKHYHSKLSGCCCTPGDPCDYHAATCVVCVGKCKGHPLVQGGC